MMYQTLNESDQEIRLLTFVGGSESDYMICQLEYHRLIDKPSYVALSYTWGDKNDTATIYLNGVEIEVRANLKIALQQLRSHDYKHVWIDAVCINQNNDKEKEQQISLMLKIYSNAKKVVVSLGAEQHMSGLVMLYFAALAKGDEPHVARPREDVHRYLDYVGCEYVNNVLPEILGLERGEVARIFEDAFKAFFQRPYWTRIWIIQEVIAAKQIQVCCGKVTVAMDEILDGLSKDVVGKEILKSGQVPDFSAFRKARVAQSGSLVRMMLLSREAHATEARDKIYALLNLAPDGNLLVRPNYEKDEMQRYKMPDATVLLNLTRAILTKQSNLKVIILRSINRAPNENLPSWVPIWNELSISRPWISERLFREWDEREGAAGELTGNWNLIINAVSVVNAVKNAISSKSPQPPQNTPAEILSFDGDRLKVWGTVLDVIDGISSQLPESIPAVIFLDVNRNMIQSKHTSRDNIFYQDQQKVALAILASLCLALEDVGPRDFEIFDEKKWSGMVMLLCQLLSNQGREIMIEEHPRLCAGCPTTVRCL